MTEETERFIDDLGAENADLASRLTEVERKHGELHDELAAEFTDRMVAEARAEAAEAALREVEEVLKLWFDWVMGVGVGEWRNVEAAVNAALKRVRTTTEETPEPRTRQDVWDGAAEGERA